MQHPVLRDIRISAENVRQWMSAPPRGWAREWNRPYSRKEAVFPAGVSCTDKYWCPVGRVDNVDGDRNLVCVWPTPDAYRDEAA